MFLIRPIRPISLICLIALTSLPWACHATEVTLAFTGKVDQTYFSARDFVPLDTPVSFIIGYDNDPVLNPDLTADPTIGNYRITRWEYVGVGRASGGQFNGLQTSNGTFDSLTFGVGSVQLPSFNNFSFNSGRITFHDPTGLALDSDALPSRINPAAWSQISFLLRWGGADGPAFGGPLRLVPEPSAGIMVLGTIAGAAILRRRSIIPHRSAPRI